MADVSKKDQSFQISVNLDTTPILYTDNINIAVNNDGVVLNVMQKLAPTNQLRIVTRVGMSREHAKKFIDTLGNLLLKTEAKIASIKKTIN